MMEPYTLIKRLDCSEDSNNDIAIKYDAGKVQSEKYGEATLSGHFLLLTPHGEFPPLKVKPIEEKACIWLNEMGQQKYRDEVFEKIKIPIMIAYIAPDAQVDKLELYFKASVFAFFFDDAVVKLNHLNENDPLKQQGGILKIAESLISIIESYGSAESTAAASKLNPIFSTICVMLSHVCSCSYEQMSEVDYKRFAREMMNFIRGYKWLHECNNSPNNENEFLILRCINSFMSPTLGLICFAKGIRISDDVMKHPLFQRYYKNICMHEAFRNDILSLQKEIADCEEKNLVLMKCRKYSLQTSIYKSEKITNELIIGLKKDKVKLESYFPADDNLKKFIQTAEYILDGFLYWYQDSKRYGQIKFETYIVEYDFDYDSWLQQEGVINKEGMKEPEFRSESNNDAIFLSLYE